MVKGTMLTLWRITQRMGYDGEDLIGVFTSEKARDNWIEKNPCTGEWSYYSLDNTTLYGDEE
jgi:hypothetical protein